MKMKAHALSLAGMEPHKGMEELGRIGVAMVPSHHSNKAAPHVHARVHAGVLQALAQVEALTMMEV